MPAVSAYVTHAVFPQAAWRKFTHAGFDCFWVTDSVPCQTDQLAGQPPFEVLSLDHTIANLLMGAV